MIYAMVFDKTKKQSYTQYQVAKSITLSKILN